MRCILACRIAVNLVGVASPCVSSTSFLAMKLPCDQNMIDEVATRCVVFSYDDVGYG